MQSSHKSKKLLIGVTGGIGAGKSLACKYFEKLGCEVFYADIAAKSLYTTNKSLKNRLISEFGKCILENNAISFSRLRELIFNSRKNQLRVNKIVHPFVLEAFAEFVNKSKSRIVVHEAALIFESGLNRKLDYIINIASTQKNRIARVRKRNIPLKTIRNVISMQLNERDRAKLADFTITNGSSLLKLKKEVKFINEILKRL